MQQAFDRSEAWSKIKFVVINNVALNDLGTLTVQIEYTEHRADMTCELPRFTIDPLWVNKEKTTGTRVDTNPL